METLSNVFELRKLMQAKEGPVLVKFIKKDATERLMLCTLDFDRIPDKDRPKDTGASVEQLDAALEHSQLLNVYDVEAQGWRKVNFKTLQWVKTHSGETHIRLSE